MESQSTNVTLTVECLCGANTFSASIPKAKLPLEVAICHCDSCRHSTGGLYMAGVTWPQPREDVDISRLSRYQFSPNVTNIFCGTCSAQLFYETAKDPGTLGVFTGALKNTDADLIKVTKHIFVEDTIDGGASVWFRKPNADGKDIPLYKERSGDMTWDELLAPSSTASKGEEQKPIPISCHCKGVNLLLHPGKYATMKKEELPWFVDPRTRKLLASFDVCDSCRIHFGVDIVNWTFIHLSGISQADGGAFPTTMAELKAAVDAADPAVGTLVCYQSSADVQRYSCKVCAASVLYTCKSRPEMVDVAVGLLEAPEGARAEGSLSWFLGDDPSWVGDTKGGWREEFTKRVQANAEEFRIARGYPKSWRRLAKEAQASSS